MRVFWFKSIAFVLVVTACLSALVAMKYCFSDRLAPQTLGLGGLLREKEVDFLFIGSSHTRQSYDVQLLERHTGKSAYLVSYNGLGPFLMEPLIRFVAENDRVRIKTYVLEVRVFGILHPPALQDTRLFFDAPRTLKHRILRLAWNDIPGFDLYSLYELVVVSNNDLILTAPVSNPLISRGSYKGGYLKRERRALRPDEFDNLKSPMPGIDAVRPDPRQLASLRNIFQYVKERNLEVVFVETPMPAPVEEDPGTILNKRYVGDLIRNEGFVYVDGAVGFDTRNPSLFVDNNHLSRTGREVFTERMADLLSERKWRSQ